MKKSILFIASFIVLNFLTSTKTFSQNIFSNMDDKVLVYSKFENFLQNVAIIYGVHGQLTQDDVHIQELDEIVSKIKKFLQEQGMNFSELAASPEFVTAIGRARICSYVLYPELETIYNVKLPKQKNLALDAYCKKLSFAQALKNVKQFMK